MVACDDSRQARTGIQRVKNMRHGCVINSFTFVKCKVNNSRVWEKAPKGVLNNNNIERRWRDTADSDDTSIYVTSRNCGAVDDDDR